MSASGGSRTGSAMLGGWTRRVDLSTDLPDDTRELLMYVKPSIDLVERLYGLRAPEDRLSEEWER